MVANGKRDLLLRGFGPTFFRDQSQESGGPDGPFIPHKYVTTGLPDEKQYYWWRTEDQPSRTQKYEKARPEVVEAWKLMQARDLAKKEAEKRPRGRSRRRRGQSANLRDVAVQNGSLEYFEVGPIAEYMPQLVPTQMRRPVAGVRQPPAEHDAGADLPRCTTSRPRRSPYPDTEMVQELLNLRKHPTGETTIVSDKPKTNYYVATLLAAAGAGPGRVPPGVPGSMARAAGVRFAAGHAVERPGRRSSARRSSSNCGRRRRSSSRSPPGRGRPISNNSH